MKTSTIWFKKIGLVAIAAFIAVIIIGTYSYAAIISTPYVSTESCVQLTQPMRYGAHDGTTVGQVSILQNFLHSEGYLSVTATGYFGSMTDAAVKLFQSQNGLPADGVVGVQTRAHIFAKGCIVPPSPIVAPTISSVTPLSGPTGTVVTITGSNFAPLNTIHFASGAVNNIPSSNNGSTIMFSIPSSIGPYCPQGGACPMYVQLLNAGTYPISVENVNGTSNVFSFTITNNSTIIPN